MLYRLSILCSILVAKPGDYLVHFGWLVYDGPVTFFRGYNKFTGCITREDHREYRSAAQFSDSIEALYPRKFACQHLVHDVTIRILAGGVSDSLLRRPETFNAATH